MINNKLIPISFRFYIINHFLKVFLIVIYSKEVNLTTKLFLLLSEIVKKEDTKDKLLFSPFIHILNNNSFIFTKLKGNLKILIAF